MAASDVFGDDSAYLCVLLRVHCDIGCDTNSSDDAITSVAVSDTITPALSEISRCCRKLNSVVVLIVLFTFTMSLSSVGEYQRTSTANTS